MKAHMKKGWGRTVKHFPVIAILFLYQLLWGFFLLRFIQSLVVPILKRYPDAMASDSAVRMFLIEAQFQLTKTDLINPYLWMLAGLFTARMLATPFINAGLFYSLRHASDTEGTKFFAGIRAAWKPVALLYCAELLLMFGPLGWLVPLAQRVLAASAGWGDVAAGLAPSAAAWLIWCAAMRLLSLALQFGAVAEESFLPSLALALRSFLPVAGVSLAMWGIGALVGLASSAASLFWAGLLALVLHQAHHFIRTWFKVWTYAAQYEVWQSKRA